MKSEPSDLTLVPGHTSLEPAQPRPCPRLRWTDSKGEHEVELRESVTAGSVASAQFVVDDRAVSRVHAQLSPMPDGLWVRDLGSRNGTYVNGVAIVEGRVPPGGTLRMGQTDITVGYGAAEAVDNLWPEKSFGGLLGRTAVMRELFAQLDRYSRSNATVLITGESGTGKELVARALHDLSPRNGAPMVVVDCAALPPNLLESELFGHARGAFTGATSAHAGAFEAAHGGTVFLDEVGELPLSLQPKLLRVLESRVIRRLGETSYRKVDIRVISATHRDLKMMVNQRAFREDLFFRLAVLPVFVPAFRDRIGDLPLLLEAFLGEKVFEIPPERMAVLAAQPWTGNVRELRNFAERVLAIGIDRASLLTFGEPDAPEEPVEDLDEAPTLSDEQRSTVEAPPVEAGAAITPLDLAEVNELFDGEFKPFRERWCDVGEREYLRRLMLRTDHAPTRASKAAALNRTYLYRLLRRHGF